MRYTDLTSDFISWCLYVRLIIKHIKSDRIILCPAYIPSFHLSKEIRLLCHFFSNIRIFFPTPQLICTIDSIAKFFHLHCGLLGGLREVFRNNRYVLVDSLILLCSRSIIFLIRSWYALVFFLSFFFLW